MYRAIGRIRKMTEENRVLICGFFHIFLYESKSFCDIMTV